MFQSTVGARHTRQTHGPSKQILVLEARPSLIKPNRLEDAIEYVLAYNYSVMNLWCFLDDYYQNSNTNAQYTWTGNLVIGDRQGTKQLQILAAIVRKENLFQVLQIVFAS